MKMKKMKYQTSLLDDYDELSNNSHFSRKAIDIDPLVGILENPLS